MPAVTAATMGQVNRIMEEERGVRVVLADDGPSLSDAARSQLAALREMSVSSRSPAWFGARATDSRDKLLQALGIANRDPASAQLDDALL